MKIEDIKQIIDIVENSKITEFRYKTSNGESIFLSKSQKIGIATTEEQINTASTTPQHTINIPTKIETEEPKNTINAPIIGTFYVAPSPDAKPFATEGQQVKEGDIIGIIEAMKIMNQIRSDKSGKVKFIIAKNGQPVEYDQPLIELE